MCGVQLEIQYVVSFHCYLTEVSQIECNVRVSSVCGNEPP